LWPHRADLANTVPNLFPNRPCRQAIRADPLAAAIWWEGSAACPDRPQDRLATRRGGGVDRTRMSGCEVMTRHRRNSAPADPAGKSHAIYDGGEVVSAQEVRRRTSSAAMADVERSRQLCCSFKVSSLKSKNPSSAPDGRRNGYQSDSKCGIICKNPLPRIKWLTAVDRRLPEIASEHVDLEPYPEPGRIRPGCPLARSAPPVL
jgi:hypothetical protein